MKKVLIICTGNSCRSIIAEALINNYCKNVKAFSAGSKPKGVVHPYAKKVLEEDGLWNDSLFSKPIEKFLNEKFDIVITVCDNAKETCPFFPNAEKVIHLPFEDPDGKSLDLFRKLKDNMKDKLIKIFSAS